MKQIIAKFNSKCSETGKQILRGSIIYFDTTTRKAYCLDSQKAKSIQEINNTKSYIQAQEDAYWDNVTGYYYSR